LMKKELLTYRCERCGTDIPGGQEKRLEDGETILCGKCYETASFCENPYCDFEGKRLVRGLWLCASCAWVREQP